MLKKIDKHYVSPIDQKLAEFNRTHRPSASQKAEIAKYQRVFSLRDQSTASNSDLPNTFWKEF